MNACISATRNRAVLLLLRKPLDMPKKAREQKLKSVIFLNSAHRPFLTTSETSAFAFVFKLKSASHGWQNQQLSSHLKNMLYKKEICFFLKQIILFKI
jgi:hypothetical protein